MYPIRTTLLLAAVALSCARPAAGEPTFAPGKNVGVVQIPALKEASGIVASRTSDKVLWVHNDSGSAAVLFAISAQGKLLGEYRLPGIAPDDTEDVAIGPGPIAGLDYIYLADIGDNAETRKQIMVSRIPEPAVYLHQQAKPPRRDLKGVHSIVLTYPDGAHNAETLLVDPQTGELLVGTKEHKVTRFYRASQAALDASGKVTLELAGGIKFHLASAGDVSPAGDLVVLRREEVAQLWHRSAGQSLFEAMKAEPIRVPVVGPPTEPNGEAIGFDANGSGYFTISEGKKEPLYYFARTDNDRPKGPRPLVAAGADWKYLDDGSDPGSAWQTGEFDDSKWKTGPAQLGYGDGDERTVVSFGGDESKRHMTTYFRHRFTLEDAASVGSLLVRLVYDDGAAVYLNGREVVRANLEPQAGPSSPATRSPSETEDSWFTFPIDRAALVPGQNTLAVEVHQRSADSSDLSFDLQLLAR